MVMLRLRREKSVMRRLAKIAAVLGLLLAGVVLVQPLGCIIDEPIDCATALVGCPMDGGTDGSESGPPPSCIPSMNSTPVADSCGVFVSSSKGSDTTGKGTKEAPYQTLAKALGAVGSQPVYACGETFTETVSISASVTVYGALVCSQTWLYDPTQKTLLTAAADAIPMTLASTAGGTVIHDFAITAADATMAGGSSIAVLDQAGVTLENVDIAAGAGMAGTPGASQAQVTTPTSANGTNGTAPTGCNMTTNILGGAGGTNTCNGTATNGGNGGKGLPASSGDDGLSGQPMTPSNGGAGQTTTPCQTGGIGNAATAGAAVAGMPGTGARGIGDVSAAGYQVPAATPAGAGQPGQGGGGGGAAHACDANDMYAGPSGGGGGAGGCGGAPGNLGTSGGSSIGILALGAQLTLTTVAITTKAGGAGGAGSSGQLGGGGGQPGVGGGTNACVGGSGGQGGAGGPGGGGAGGHSVGIAIKNGTLPSLGSTTITPGSGAMGGAGGDTTAQTQGDAGLGCKTLDFTNPAMTPPACTM
jgi:hypothetical protein